MVEIRTVAHNMVPAKQVILYANALPQPKLIHTKYTLEHLKETSKNNIITTAHRSTTEKTHMTSPSQNTYGK